MCFMLLFYKQLRVNVSLMRVTLLTWSDDGCSDERLELNDAGVNSAGVALLPSSGREGIELTVTELLPETDSETRLLCTGNCWAVSKTNYWMFSCSYRTILLLDYFLICHPPFPSCKISLCLVTFHYIHNQTSFWSTIVQPRPKENTFAYYLFCEKLRGGIFFCFLLNSANIKTRNLSTVGVSIIYIIDSNANIKVSTSKCWMVLSHMVWKKLEMGI